MDVFWVNQIRLMNRIDAGITRRKVWTVIEPSADVVVLSKPSTK